MPSQKLISRQQVAPDMLEHAKAMRHEMTPAESELWNHLRNNRLEGFHFRRQQVIGPYIVDFLCNPVGLVVEVDGDVHFGQEDHDRQRDRDLCAMGLRVLHFWNDDVHENLDEVLETILLACKSQSLPNPQPLPVNGKGQEVRFLTPIHQRHPFPPQE